MMKKKLILSFFFVALGFGVVKAQDLPDKKETLKTVTKVNDYFMKKYADYRTPSFVKNVTRPSNIWTRGVYYEGLMALYSVSIHAMTIINTLSIGQITTNGDSATVPPLAMLMITVPARLTLIYITFVPIRKESVRSKPI